MKLLIIAISCLILGCQSPKLTSDNPGTAVTVIYDVTDKRIEVPNSQSVLPYYHFNEDKSQGAFFRMVHITDKVVNPSLQVNFLPQSQTEKLNKNNDPYFREKQVLGFYASVRQTIERQLNDTIGYNHSEVFRAIAMELNEIMQKPANHKYLLVYSDLQECSSLANTYVQTDSKIVESLFERTGLLPKNLNNCIVQIVFQPKDRLEDTRFLKLYKIYEKLLTKKGAIVKLSTIEQNTIL